MEIRMRYMVHLISLLVALTTAVMADASWGYNADNGPATWPGVCQTGFRQSPIDFNLGSVEISHYNKLHFVHYHNAGSVNVTNNGHSVTVSGFETWGPNQPYIYSGGLAHKYKLVQFHAHWSQDYLTGSEHTVGGLHYPAEVHFVHIRDGYTVATAANLSDGIAVVGVFLNLGTPNVGISMLKAALSDVVSVGPVTKVDGFRPKTLLPQNTESFYRYEGSLTTPGCNEAVIWTVLTDPVTVTEDQLNLFRNLKDHHDNMLATNYRPTQPLNGRQITFRPSNFDRIELCGSAPTLRGSISAFIATIASIWLPNM
uniref:Carbonic anhydrase n=1 Tax=Panagrellus redivivus TaxID=6233 RepID=A0A7E4USR0_PANRE